MDDVDVEAGSRERIANYTSSFSGSFPWYRTSLRHGFIAIYALGALFSIIAINTDRCGDENTVFWYISFSFYLVFLFYMIPFYIYLIDGTPLLSSSIHDTAAATATDRPRHNKHQLIFVIITIIMKLMMIALAIYSLVQTFIAPTSCSTRVWAMFVVAIDIAIPISTILYSMLRKGLQLYAAHCEKKQAAGRIEPFLGSIYMAIVFWFLLLTIWSIVACIIQRQHTWTTQYYNGWNSYGNQTVSYLTNWIMCIVYTVIHAIGLIGLCGILIYRITSASISSLRSVSTVIPAIMSDLVESSEFALPSILTIIIFLLLHLVASIISFIFLILNIHCGGLAILTIINILTSGGILLTALIVGVLHAHSIKQCLDQVACHFTE